MADTHGFRSQTAVVAYCGAVERPDPDKPRIVSDSTTLPDNACPECVTAYLGMRS